MKKRTHNNRSEWLPPIMCFLHFTGILTRMQVGKYEIYVAIIAIILLNIIALLFHSNLRWVSKNFDRDKLKNITTVLSNSEIRNYVTQKATKYRLSPSTASFQSSF